METNEKPPEFFTHADLLRIGIRLSNTQRLRLEAVGRFPRRVHLTPARVVYVAAEIRAWLDARIAEREHRLYSSY